MLPKRKNPTQSQPLHLWKKRSLLQSQSQSLLQNLINRVCASHRMERRPPLHHHRKQTNKNLSEGNPCSSMAQEKESGDCSDMPLKTTNLIPIMQPMPRTRSEEFLRSAS